MHGLHLRQHVDRRPRRAYDYGHDAILVELGSHEITGFNRSRQVDDTKVVADLIV
jgi:hypothetical protein